MPRKMEESIESSSQQVKVEEGGSMGSLSSKQEKYE